MRGLIILVDFVGIIYSIINIIYNICIVKPAEKKHIQDSPRYVAANNLLDYEENITNSVVIIIMCIIGLVFILIKGS